MPRPKLPEHRLRSEVLQLRLTIDERKKMKAGADSAGEQLSEFIRGAALEKAMRLQKTCKND